MGIKVEKRIGIANDHAGFGLKMHLLQYLEHQLKIDKIYNFGSDSSQKVDYPDYAKKVINAIETSSINFGILICGTGIGMSICANRKRFIRAALCANLNSAKLAIEHNNANVLALGAKYLSVVQGQKIIKAFISAKFSAARHLVRLNKCN